MVLAVDLLGDNIVDLGEVGIDDDHAIAAVLELIELDLLALIAEGSLGLGSGQSIGVLGQLAIVIDLSDLVALLDAESLADVALSGSNMESGVGSSDDGGIHGGVLSVVLGVVVSVLGPNGGRTAPIVSAVAGDELEVLVTQAGLVELLNLIGHIAEGRSVGDHGLLNSAEQDLGNQLTGSGSAEVGGLGNVLQNAELLGILGNVQGPVSAGELTVLVVADSAQDHREDLVAGHVAGLLEGAIGITLDELSVGAVADVTGSPTGTGHVAELVVGGVQTGLVVLGDVAGVDTIDDRSHFCTGDVALGLEGTIFITLEHIHAIQNGNGLSVISADVLVILEGTGADSQRQSHDQSQHHCE